MAAPERCDSELCFVAFMLAGLLLAEAVGTGVFRTAGAAEDEDAPPPVHRFHMDMGKEVVRWRRPTHGRRR